MPLRSLDRVGEDLASWASSTHRRVPTGYHIYDSRMSGGIATGEMAVLICQSGVGKTWFGVNLTRNNPGVPTVFFSLEMHGRYILQRLAGAHTDTPTSQIEATLKRGHLSSSVQHTIDDFPLLRIEDDPEIGFGDMSDRLQEYTDEVGQRPRLIVIDYLELIRSFETGVEHVDSLARSAKRFAREEDVALVVLHQIKRRDVKVPYIERGREKTRTVPNVGQAPLTAQDSRFGGNVQADYVLGMYRPSLDPDLTAADAAFIEHDLRLQLLKTRTDGGLAPIGVQHFWNAATGRISELRNRHGLLFNDGPVAVHPEAVARV